MSSHAQYSAVLQCHPDTACTAVESIQTTIGREQGKLLTAVYVVNGVVDDLRLPPERSPRRGDDLWRHTCFELFIGAENDTEYYEFNFSSSGEWAAYGFRDYRDGKPIDFDGLEPRIAVQQDAGRLELRAVIHLDLLPGFRPDLSLRLGLSAVIEDRNGSLSFWALKHPLGKPDFHHSDNFILQIEPAAVDGEAIDYTAKP